MILTSDETDFLIKNYATLGRNRCRLHLNLTINQIKSLARKLKLKENLPDWTKIDEYLIKNYKNLGRRVCAQNLGIPVFQVKARAKILQLKVKTINWNEIDKYLLANYSKLGRATCIKHLNITVNQIKFRTRKLRLTQDKVWTTEDDHFLTLNYPSTNKKYCAEKLNKTVSQIKARVKFLDLKLIKKYPKIGHQFCCTCKIEKTLSSFDKCKKMNHRRECKDCRYKQRRTKENKSWWGLYRKKRMKDPLFNMVQRHRNKTRKVLKGIHTESGLQYLGCSREHFIDHLKSTMTPNMTWELALNGKLIHIDHIKSIDSFKNLLTSEEERKECFGYQNLRLIWATTELCMEYGDIHLIGNLNKGNTDIIFSIPQKRERIDLQIRTDNS